MPKEFVEKVRGSHHTRRNMIVNRTGPAGFNTSGDLKKQLNGTFSIREVSELGNTTSQLNSFRLLPPMNDTVITNLGNQTLQGTSSSMKLAIDGIQRNDKLAGSNKVSKQNSPRNNKLTSNVRCK